MLRPLLLLSSCRYYDIRMWERFEELNFEPEAFLTEGVSLWKELGISERNISLMSDNMLSGWIDREIDTCTAFCGDEYTIFAQTAQSDTCRTEYA